VINPSFHLFQLQKIDLKVDSLNKRLSEIDRIRNDNSARKIIEQSLSSFSEVNKNQKRSYAEIEDRVKTKKLKIEQSESSLYGGSIKNPKELQDLQSEIKSLKQSLASLEDEQLQKLMDQEATEKEISVVQKTLQDFDTQLQIQFSSLFAEEDTKKVELEKLMQEHKAVLDQINPENLTIYQALRKLKNGIALSTIEDGCCAVCGSTLTPADCQTAKSPIHMATCSSCGRILYAG
jgi:predicted  nucleic acid-binding Zn-ribbon protein